MSKKETVCAVVVTYNRKELLTECLEGLLKQTRPIDAIYLIDNFSNDGTPELLKEEGYIDELPPKDLKEPWEKMFVCNNILLYYVRMHENTGGSGGFYEGVKRTYSRDYEWLWLMDDDVEADKNTLEELLKYRSLNNGNVVLMPARFYNNALYTAEAKTLNYSNPLKKFCSNYIEKVDLSNDYFEIATFPFEGPLISKKVIDSIGLPMKELFIFSDDTYYASKVYIDKRLKTFMISSAKLHKKLSSSDEFFNWKVYYALRNMIILDKIFAQNILVKDIRPIFMLILYVLKYEKKTIVFKYLLKAYKDGIKIKLGKRVLPGEV